MLCVVLLKISGICGVSNDSVSVVSLVVCLWLLWLLLCYVLLDSMSDVSVSLLLVVMLFVDVVGWYVVFVVVSVWVSVWIDWCVEMFLWVDVLCFVSWCSVCLL